MRFSTVISPSWRALILIVGSALSQSIISLQTWPGLLLSIALLNGTAFAIFGGIDKSSAFLSLVFATIVVSGAHFRLFIRGFGRAVQTTFLQLGSFSSQGRLREAIKRVFENQDGSTPHARCPLFATLSVTRFWFDPDFPSFSPFPFPGDNVGDLHRDTMTPILGPGWLPLYVNLTNFTKDELVDTMMQSAALPMVFRMRKLFGADNLDGGITDNTPINKALEFSCDVLVVIYLKSDVSLPAKVVARVPRLQRAIRLSQQAPELSHGQYMEWFARQKGTGHQRYYHDWDLPIPNKNEIVPEEMLSQVPTMINVVPSIPLGGLFFGTLNFSTTKCRRLRNLGKDDVIRILGDHLAVD